MPLGFVKMHGLGNDFVVIEDLERTTEFDPVAVSWICDRRFGIGADGLVVIRAPRDTAEDFSWDFYNSDGSTAEMCGNGIRCVSKYLADRGKAAGGRVRIGTLLGVHEVEYSLGADGRMAEATVDMGEPVLRPSEVPTLLGADGEVALRRPLDTGLGVIELTCVSLGNPHAVTWVEDVDDTPVRILGPVIEHDSAFPHRTNVEFAHVRTPARMALRVWERGVGETLACGTGACAALVAAVLEERIDGRAATVELPGGELFVRWSEDDRVYMTGPAREVYTGVLDLPEG